jgi:glucokinase
MISATAGALVKTVTYRNNDAHAAALGEWYFGSGQGCQDFVYVTVSTGIGGGIIANGQLLLGRKGLAGEIGHMQIQSEGPVCSCGQIGCWESLASGTALARFAVQALQRKSPSLLHEPCPPTAMCLFSTLNLEIRQASSEPLRCSWCL